MYNLIVFKIIFLVKIYKFKDKNKLYIHLNICVYPPTKYIIVCAHLNLCCFAIWTGIFCTEDVFFQRASVKSINDKAGRIYPTQFVLLLTINKSSVHIKPKSLLSKNCCPWILCCLIGNRECLGYCSKPLITIVVRH